VIPFSVPAKVIAAVIVFALVRTMFGIVPIEGPPRTITAAITFAGTENGITAGPVTFSGSGSVTVTTGSTWHLLV
jgi:hypothetical protein